jgi:hypothetical protein
MKLLALGVLIGSVLAFALAASGAAPHRPGLHREKLETPAIHWLQHVRTQVDATRSKRCLPKLERRWGLYEVPAGLRRMVIRQELQRWREARKASSRCLPTTPSGIIRYVFPSSTEDAAIRVAWCESRLNPRADNPRSTAAGLFQLLATWYAGKFNPYDAWANTRFALRLSNGGRSWSHWRASIGCHGLA